MTGRGSQRTTTDQPRTAPLSEAAAADYLSEILPDLVHIADRGGLDMVAYLLEMARIAAAESALQPQKTKAR